MSWLAALLLCGGALGAQDDAPPMPAGAAVLDLDQRAIRLSFVLTPEGPLFALEPIAGLVGAELRIGPLGDSHTLLVGARRIVVGPQSATCIITSEGEPAPEVVPISHAPLKLASGLHVPLDFLDRALGEELGYEFLWRPRELRLEVAERQARQLTIDATLVHQHRVTTLELRFSEPPRYRIERLEGALEVHFIGDRLSEPVQLARSAGSLVEEVVSSPDTLRIVLADGATAAEPRLLNAPAPRLIVEVFRGGPNRDDPKGGPLRERPAPASGGVRVVVLDPGHGGSESGAVGASGSAEKDLTLLIARTLERRLERRLPVRVILTRTEDVELPLDARTALANQNRADLFISLHLNSSFGSTANGAETYFLSREASDRMAAAAAEEENRSSLDDPSPESDLRLILWDLAQTHHLAESQRFANLVQEELNQALGLQDRGVKQAPFRVLMGAAMPAVLVELGFLSNPSEEAKLQQAAYREKLVDALVRAVLRFKAQLESGPPREEVR